MMLRDSNNNIHNYFLATNKATLHNKIIDLRLELELKI